MNFKKKIYIAGHNGMVGRAISKKLQSLGFTNLVGKSRGELDLTNTQMVVDFFKNEQPEIVIDAAARVGGIFANNGFQYDFLMENLQIQNNLINTSHEAGVEKFIFLGSSCVYPKHAPQPIKEEYLLTGSLEPSNAGYAIAKISGISACKALRNQFSKDFLSLVPTNLYGYFDNFDLNSSHVLPAMLRKFHEAKIKNNEDVTLWGSGTPMRDFLFVEDMADAVAHCLKTNLSDYFYNVGSGKDVTINNLAKTIQNVVGHDGNIIWDTTKPDGAPRKLLDSSKLNTTGWNPKTELENGIIKTYNWYLENINILKYNK